MAISPSIATPVAPDLVPPQKPEARKPTPPIPDVNGDGVLDGEDILKQMEKEEENGLARTPNERAHGVFEAINARSALQELNRVAKEEPQHYGLALHEVTLHIIERLNVAVDYVNQRAASMPDYRTRLSDEVAAFGKKEELSQDKIAVLLADQHNLADFAQTVATTFPKGIALHPKETLQILLHFGPAHVPIARPATTPESPSR